METDTKGLSIIFHSGSYDRVFHGFSLVLVALALGRDTKCFFTYWSLPYLIKGKSEFQLDVEGQSHKKLLEDHMKRTHAGNIKAPIGSKNAGGKVLCLYQFYGLAKYSPGRTCK